MTGSSRLVLWGEEGGEMTQVHISQFNIHAICKYRPGFYLGQKFWGGNRGGRAGVIIVKQELCVL